MARTAGTVPPSQAAASRALSCFCNAARYRNPGRLVNRLVHLPCTLRDGNVVALDWVGHGRSEVHDDDAHYSADALLADLIDVYGRFATERNILVGHSYGTALTTMLVPHALKLAPVAAVVLIGAVASVPPVTAKTALRLASVPIWVLDLMRAFHRLGGVHSSSVRQMVRPRGKAL